MRSSVFAYVKHLALLCALVLLAGCANDHPEQDFTWLVRDPNRSDSDRSIDQRRDPEKLLEFYGVRPGMRVMDISAGRGYNTELLARVVGPKGRVYAQNSPKMYSGATQAGFEERMKNPVNTVVTPVVRDFDDPVPSDVRDLDLVTFNFNYHDTVWMGVDRAKLNRAVFDALKRGGVYIVADHSAKPGSGLEVTKSLHRIDEALVRREVEAAGFKLAASADFLRNADDPRDAPVFKNPIRNDEFVLKFVKP